jgi:hypothetical protein
MKLKKFESLKAGRENATKGQQVKDLATNVSCRRMLSCTYMYMYIDKVCRYATEGEARWEVAVDGVLRLKRGTSEGRGKESRNCRTASHRLPYSTQQSAHAQADSKPGGARAEELQKKASVERGGG